MGGRTGLWVLRDPNRTYHSFFARFATIMADGGTVGRRGVLTGRLPLSNSVLLPDSSILALLGS